jgi:peptidoglycan hydrolase-like protein with peptidoglycan-binding domain
MDCPKCKTANPEGKRFCGDCGSSLDAIDEEFRKNVQAVVREQLRDRLMVEIETADAVLLRLKTWSKPFLYAVAVLVAVLGLLGFRSLRDAMDGLRNAQQQALQSLRQQAATESKSLEQEAAAMRAKLQKVDDRDLEEKWRQAESQLTKIQAAGKKLKERYESASTELAQVQSGSEDPKVSHRIGMTRRSGDGAGDGPRYVAPGSSGADVQRIQQRLAQLGCYHGEATGNYDGATKSAVERFNQARGDPLATGVVDPPTWEALFSKKVAASCRTAP